MPLSGVTGRPITPPGGRYNTGRHTISQVEKCTACPVSVSLGDGHKNGSNFLVVVGGSWLSVTQ